MTFNAVRSNEKFCQAFSYDTTWNVYGAYVISSIPRFEVAKNTYLTRRSDIHRKYVCLRKSPSGEEPLNLTLSYFQLPTSSNHGKIQKDMTLGGLRCPSVWWRSYWCRAELRAVIVNDRQRWQRTNALFFCRFDVNLPDWHSSLTIMLFHLQYKIISLLALVASASAFAPAPFGARASTACFQSYGKVRFLEGCRIRNLYSFVHHF